MKFYCFHLMPYADLDLDYYKKYNSAWVTLPNSYYDPKKGHILYNRYLDELEYAEEVGFDGVCVNEHHSNAYGLMPIPGVMAGALARRTKRVKIAVLGRALPLINNPLTVAEEFAMIDVITAGRLVAGFVRGIGAEYHSWGVNPAESHDRFHEAHDLIVRGWNETGPFAFEGKYYHFNYVNVWPRPYQQPHPPIWVSTTSPSGAARVGSRGFVQATFLTGFDGTRAVFDAYRKGWRDAGRGDHVPLDRLAYAALVYTAPSAREARAGAEKLMWYVTANKIVSQFTYPPGYVPVKTAVDVIRGRINAVSHFGETPTVENAIKSGVMFAGTPDQVMAQIRAVYDYVGGFGHLLMMGQAGFLEHDETVLSIKTFAREVYPRLKEVFAAEAVA